MLNWDTENGLQGMAELCHGCGGCRTSQEGTGEVMCPTYRAAQEEITNTQGRANMLRQAMTNGLDEGEAFIDKFVTEVMDLCVGCKGCAKDCPSEVDMANLKAEVEHEYHQRHGASFRDRLFANIHVLSKLGSLTAPVRTTRRSSGRASGTGADRRYRTRTIDSGVPPRDVRRLVRSPGLAGRSGRR